VQASGGTLFLDEVGDLPLALQARLLHVLQERSVTAPGSTEPMAVDIALIVASRRNLREMVERQEFREELYYRLNGLSLRLPALRERADLEAIVMRILHSQRPHDTPELGPQVLELFRRYAWPGNVRQLTNVLRIAAVMSAGERQITTAHLADDFLEDALRFPMAARGTTPASSSCAAQASRGAATVEAPHTLEQAEIEMIRAALDAAKGNISAASKQLGISRNTIYRKLRWNIRDRSP
jgi:sigma-54 dependent transcriptional regulator, acetoin dehydrogenase operon transcriptional activator AcoR